MLLIRNNLHHWNILPNYKILTKTNLWISTKVDPNSTRISKSYSKWKLRKGIIFLASVSHQRLLVVFHWRLSESKFLHVSRTFHGIPTNIKIIEFWIISILFLISNSSRPLSKSLWTVPNALNTIDITCYGAFFVLCQSQSIYMWL